MKSLKFPLKSLLCFFLIVVSTALILAAQSTLDLIPVNTVTHTAVQSGSWFSPATWNTGTVPSDAAIVHIPTTITVGYTGQSAAHIFAIRVDGEFHCSQPNTGQVSSLTFDTFLGSQGSLVKFVAEDSTDGEIVVTISPFDIESHKNGLSGFPQVWNANASSHFQDGLNTWEVTYDIGPDSRFNTYADALAGSTSVTELARTLVNDGPGVLGRYSWDSTQLSLGLIAMGEIEILGQAKLNMAKLSADALLNQALLQLDTVPTGWKAGDQLVVTKGGNLGAANNGEDLLTIQTISGNSITCNSNLQKNHEGRPQDDLHCYVGNLSRNITFHSANSSNIHQRGHFMVRHTNINAQIKNAAFVDMGRTDKDRLLDDFVWKNWLEPKVFNSKISALGQECSELKLNPAQDITNIRGRYSIHLHHTGAQYGANRIEVTGNVVWGNPGWGITQHNSHANVSQNVVYDVVGAGIVSESGGESGFWDNNLVVNIQKGHNTDIYDAVLFYDDYLFRGEGLGMKGRGVMCRGNVIASANRGVGVMNMNPAINNLDRMDPLALANLRPGFLVDQFPLSRNGYSIEGDGVMPVEVALIMEETTIIDCYQALRSVERDMGVNHESRSVFDGFTAWGISQGLSITYQADYSFRNVFISGRNPNSIGAYLWKHSHNHVFDKIKMVDLRYGVTVSKLVESGNGSLKTRNNGFTPWYFIDLDTVNVDSFYQITKEDPNTSVLYQEHGDNPIHLSSTEIRNRPVTFTILDSADLVVDVLGGDLRFEIDGVITDDLGSYDMGIKQAWAQGTLRLDYPKRIYEFASQQKFEEFLTQNGVYKDTASNDQLYFILNEHLPNRRSFQYTSFPVRVKINNAPVTGVFATPQIESPANFLPSNQMASRFASVSQSSTNPNIVFDTVAIDVSPEKAIDGNNNGRINVQLYQQGLVPAGSFSETNVELEPWYELDLGELKTIDFIDLWNTVELNGPDIELVSPHFSNFYVLVSDSAFGNMGLASARNMASHEFYNGNPPRRKFSLDSLGIEGQYVRIQAVGMNKIAMAEVEIIGRTWLDTLCNQPITSIDSQTACGSYTWIDGNTYTANNNIATHTMSSALGCDSVISLNLTINNLAATVTQGGVTLTASPAGAAYQWIDCNAGNATISGETAQTFVPSNSGSYAAIIVQNNCTDTSSCINYTATVLGEKNQATFLYPNPSNGKFKVDFGKPIYGAKAVLRDHSGKLIQEKIVNGQSMLSFDLNLASGKYFLFLKSESESHIYSFVIEADE